MSVFGWILLAMNVGILLACALDGILGFRDERGAKEALPVLMLCSAMAWFVFAIGRWVIFA